MDKIYIGTRTHIYTTGEKSRLHISQDWQTTKPRDGLVHTMENNAQYGNDKQ